MTQTTKENTDMTQGDTSYSSSIKTEASKPWIDVARLGQRIVHELEIHKNASVLERWMAQRVAELINRAESATDIVVRETAAKECEDLILRLWSKRNSWPSGGPLSSVMPTLNRLLSKPDSYYRNFFEQESDSLGLIGKLIRLHEREMQLFLSSPNVAVSKEVADVSEEKLERFIDDLAEEEIQVLHFAIKQKFEETEVDESESPEIEPADDELQAIIYKTKDSFERLAKEREKLFEQVLSSQQKA